MGKDYITARKGFSYTTRCYGAYGDMEMGEMYIFLGPYKKLKKISCPR